MRPRPRPRLGAPVAGAPRLRARRRPMGAAVRGDRPQPVGRRQPPRRPRRGAGGAGPRRSGAVGPSAAAAAGRGGSADVAGPRARRRSSGSGGTGARPSRPPTPSAADWSAASASATCGPSACGPARWVALGARRGQGVRFPRARAPTQFRARARLALPPARRQVRLRRGRRRRRLGVGPIATAAAGGSRRQLDDAARLLRPLTPGVAAGAPRPWRGRSCWRRCSCSCLSVVARYQPAPGPRRP